MEEIKIGEYVRTKDGIIAKVTATGYGIDCDRDVFDLKCLQMMEMPPEHVQEYVKKHSFNIIDLIEEDDYVNGMCVSYVRFPNDPYEPTEIYVLDKHINFIFASDIKSVVTHEQMEAMEYEVK